MFVRSCSSFRSFSPVDDRVFRRQALTQNGLNLILEFDISPNGYTGRAPDVDFTKEPGMVSVRSSGALSVSSSVHLFVCPFIFMFRHRTGIIASVVRYRQFFVVPNVRLFVGTVEPF